MTAAPLVAYVDGPGCARTSPHDALAAAGLSGSPEVFLGWVVERLPWLADPSLRGRAAMAGYALAPAVADGRLTPLSIRLSAIPALLHHLRPAVCVVTGVRRGDRLVYGSTVGWGPAATAASDRVVVEIDEEGFDFGGPEITGNIVATVPRPAVDGPVDVEQRDIDDIDRAIGANVMSLVPDGATLQFGPGGIGEGIARAIDRPVGISSGLVTDAMADVAARGLLVGRVTAGYVQGGASVRELARAGLLNLERIEVTHDIGRLASIERFVACNTAIEVGLDGSVNVEAVGGRTITSIGGHSDFSAAGTLSRGGLSVIALRSTTRKGASTIVPQVSPVSTQRSDVSAVVTEHGVADLRGVGINERAARLVAIAAPEHRANLGSGSPL